MKNKVTMTLVLVCLILTTKCTYTSDSHPPDIDDPVPTEASALAMAWSYPITDERIGSTIIEDGYAYFGSNGRPTGVEMYDLQSQLSHWTILETTNTHLLSGDGKLYLLDQDEGTLSAVSKEDGIVVWHIPLPVQRNNYEMAFGSNLLFLGAGDIIYAIDVADGHTLWQRSLPSDFRINQAWLGNSSVYQDYNALSYYDRLLYVRLWKVTRDQTVECLLLAMDVIDGQEKWRFAFDIPILQESPPPMIASQPAFYNDMLFFSDWTGQIYLMDKETGEIIWQDNAEFPVVRPLFQDERVYLPTSDSLLCFNAETGARLWSTSLSGLRIVSPIRAIDSKIVFIVDHWRGKRIELVTIDGKNGESTDRLEIPLVEDCTGCVTAFEVESNRLYMTQQRTIAAIDLLFLSKQ